MANLKFMSHYLLVYVLGINANTADFLGNVDELYIIVHPKQTLINSIHT